MTLDIMTPDGSFHLTPEDGKALLDGKSPRIQSGLSGTSCGVNANLILGMQICAQNPDRADSNHYFMIAEPPVNEEAEDFGMTM